MGNVFHKLARKILRKSATQAERRFMDTYYDAFDRLEDRDDVFTEAERASVYQHIDEGIQARIRQKRTIYFRKWLPYAAAAVMLVVMIGMWALFSSDRHWLSGSVIAAAEVLPGGGGATLTLTDGRTIALSEAQAGIVVGDEKISYSDGDTVLSVPSETLVLTTPKGGTYQITLADGTKVWLNAASTLTYPSRFENDTREVMVSGEAYFEVATDKSKPFRVNSEGQTVEVLGTAFNISAYSEETATKTTLVEGAVQLINQASNAVHRLVPGEQAVFDGADLQISKVDIEPYTAWKDGFFYFDNVSPRKAIEQVARWYDLTVAYEGTIPETPVFGMVDRTKPLSAVLKSLAKSGLAFELRSKGTTKQLSVRSTVD